MKISQLTSFFTIRLRAIKVWYYRLKIKFKKKKYITGFADYLEKESKQKVSQRNERLAKLHAERSSGIADIKQAQFLEKTKDGGYIWLNRKQRRALYKKKKQGSKNETTR